MHRRLNSVVSATLCAFGLACTNTTDDDFYLSPGGTLNHMCEARPAIAVDDEAWAALPEDFDAELKGPKFSLVANWPPAGSYLGQGSALDIEVTGPVSRTLLYEGAKQQGCPTGTLLAYQRPATARVGSDGRVTQATGDVWIVTDMQGNWMMDGLFMIDVGESPDLDTWAQQELGTSKTLSGLLLFAQGHPSFDYTVAALDIEHERSSGSTGQVAGVWGTWNFAE